MPRVVREIGNERQGGYRMVAQAPCLEDASGLTDAQVLEQFIQHTKRKCACPRKGDSV